MVGFRWGTSLMPTLQAFHAGAIYQYFVYLKPRNKSIE